jgi:sec-independent protein translocase protein TatA
MCHKWFKRQMSFYYGNTEEKGHKLYAIGTLEIFLIVVAVVLIFGVGKLGEIGGALGKSIREFNREKNKIDDVPQSTMKEIKGE